jgi:hypothetical protein
MKNEPDFNIWKIHIFNVWKRCLFNVLQNMHFKLTPLHWSVSPSGVALNLEQWNQLKII